MKLKIDDLDYDLFLLAYERANKAQATVTAFLNRLAESYGLNPNEYRFNLETKSFEPIVPAAPVVPTGEPIP